MAAKLWRLDIVTRSGNGTTTAAPYYFHPCSPSVLKEVCKLIKRQSSLRLEAVHLTTVSIEEVCESD